MNKKALFITTKNIDYLRNVQEIEMLKNNGYQTDLHYSKGKNYIKRIWDIYATLLLKKTKKYDLIFIGFAPQLVLPFFNWKFRKNKIVIDFFISVYDTFVNDRKKIKSGSFLAKIIHSLDKKTLDLSEMVIADTEAHKEYFVKEFQVDPEKVQVKYLKADTNIYKPMKVEKTESLKDKFVVLYFGSILPLQGVEIVLEAAEKLKENKEIHFLIIGPIKSNIKKIKSETITYYDWLSQKELAEKIAMSDLCLAGHFSDTIDKANRTIPGKAYIYSAMNKPMILGNSKANHELYRESLNVLFSERGNADDLVEKILIMKDNLCKDK